LKNCRGKQITPTKHTKHAKGFGDFGSGISFASIRSLPAVAGDYWAISFLLDCDRFVFIRLPRRSLGEGGCSPAQFTRRGGRKPSESSLKVERVVLRKGAWLPRSFTLNALAKQMRLCRRISCAFGDACIVFRRSRSTQIRHSIFGFRLPRPPAKFTRRGGRKLSE
jgi:hypothetical protein